MKKRRYHVIKYIQSCRYYVVYATDLSNYPKFHGTSKALTVKLIKVFDDRDEATVFTKAINLL